MIEVFDGLALWDQVAPRFGIGQRRAAVAYLGAGASRYLGLQKGDVLVFDGHRSSVAQGHIDVGEVRKMLRAGVRLYTRAGLHSKMMVVEAKAPIAIVGSANASKTSATKKSETVVLFDDPVAVQSVRDAIAGLTVGLMPIGRQWVDTMAPLVPKRRGSESTFNIVAKIDAPLAKKSKPMWAWPCEWAPERYYTRQVNEAVARAQATKGVVVQPLALRGPDSNSYDEVRVGDSVLLVRIPANAKAPRHNTRVDEPGVVIDKIPRASGKGGDLLIAWRHNSVAIQWCRFPTLFQETGLEDQPGKVLPTVRRDIFGLFTSIT